MNGSVFFLNSECYFSFDGQTMELYCVNGEAKILLWDKLSNGTYSLTKKEIPTNRLEGHSFDLNRDVVFYIDSIGYGYHGSFDTEKIILKINVLKHVVIKRETCNRNILVLGSKQFHKFLYLFPQYNLTFKQEDKIADVVYESRVLSDKAEFIYKGKKFTAFPCPNIRTQGINFDFIPEIHIECDENLTEDEMFSLIEIFYKIISLLFLRNNIVPDYIRYYSNNLQYDIYYHKSIDYVEEKEDVNSIRKYGFIRWNIINKCFQKIVDDFVDGNVTTKHLENSSESRKWIDFKKIATISSFFESTYRLIYGEKINHRTSTQKTIDLITETLLPLKERENKKTRDTVDYLINQLNHVSLETKIKKALKEYDEYLSIVKKEFGLEKKEISEIASTCAQIRNWTDHGDKRAETNSFIASCFAYLTCATYAMYLKRWGIDDQLISNVLLELFLV